MATVDLTPENFKDVIEQNDFVVIDFWAPWCGPCQSFGPVYDQVSEKHDDVVFAKVNTQEQQELAGMFGIRSIPTLMLFREQVVLYKEPGALPQSSFEQLIEEARGLDMEKVHKEVAEQQKQQAQS